MSGKVISVDRAPAAIGPYSQGVAQEGFLFVSGQLPLDPETGEMVDGGAAGGTRRALQNVQAILEAQGLSLADIVKVTVFLTQMDDYPVVNEVYAEVFGGWQPARSVVQVMGLPKNALLEIEAIAMFPKGR